MTAIEIGGDRLEWPMSTIKEDRLRDLLDALPSDVWDVWQHANIGPDIRIFGMADLRFGTKFFRRRKEG